MPFPIGPEPPSNGAAPEILRSVARPELSIILKSFLLPDRTKAAIFDLDGTIMDINRSRKMVLEETADKVLNIWGSRLSPGARAELAAALGVPGKDPCKVAAELIYAASALETTDRDMLLDGPEELSKALRLLRRISFEEHVDAKRFCVDMVPGARELICSLAASGIRLAICSGSPRYMIERGLRAAGLADLFEVIVSGDSPELGPGTQKPAAQPYLLAVRKLGLQAEECVAFEDSLSGTLSALRAGLVTIVRGGDNLDQLLQAIVSSDEIVGHIDSLHLLGPGLDWGTVMPPMQNGHHRTVQ